MSKPLTEREVLNENLKIWHNEINVFHDLLSDLKNIELKQIDIRRKDRNKHDHPDINEDKLYMYLYNGKLKLGYPKTKYHGGWEFDVGWNLVGLGSLDGLFETNLKKYPSTVTERLKKPNCTGCEDSCEGGENHDCFGRLNF